jgi:hypothetical protein
MPGKYFSDVVQLLNNSDVTYLVAGGYSEKD